jgi:hypothetical protein
MITDHDDLNQLQAAIYAVLDELEKMVEEFAAARSVIEHASDRRKQLLARFVQAATGKAMNEREAWSRANPDYDKGLTRLESDYATAERTIARYFLKQARLDSLRSVLSCQKALIGL